MKSIDERDILPEEVAQVEGRILLKNTPAWSEAWSDVKELLASREHIPRKPTSSSRNRGRVEKTGYHRAPNRQCKMSAMRLSVI